MNLRKQSVLAIILLLPAVSVRCTTESTEDIVFAISHLLARGARVEQAEVISVRNVGRRRRSSQQDHPEIALDAFGRSIRLKLRRNRRLVGPNFELGPNARANGNHNSPPTTEAFAVDTTCFYMGSVVGEPQTKAAISLCEGGVRGMIDWGSDDGQMMAIYPLPAPLTRHEDHTGNDYTHNSYPNANLTDPHVVVRINQTTMLRADLHDSSDKVMIREVPRELSRHSRSHTWVPAALTHPSSGRRGNSTRVRTQSAVVEAAFFVDESLYKHIEQVFPKDTYRQVVIFALTLINQLQVVYEQESLGGFVSITLTYLEIMYPQQVDKLPPNQDYDYYLTSFCIYQQARRNTRDSDYSHWDYAVLISAMNMFARNKHGEKMKDVVGMTAVGGMCNELHSCALLEGRDLQSAHIIAHETGHSLGMEHDGEGENSACPWNKFIMSSTTGFSKKTWSKCSLKSLRTFLMSERADCLYKRSSNKVLLSEAEARVFKQFPGVHYSADQQCETKFGDKHRRARTQSLEDVCRILKCEQDTEEGLLVRVGGYTAMEGTTCGSNKWCRGGTCTMITDADRDVLRAAKASSAWNFRGSANNGDRTPLLPSGRLIPVTPPTYVVTSPEPVVQAVWTPWSAWGSCESGCTARTDRLPKGIRISTRNCIDANTNATLALDRCTGSTIRSQLCTATCVSARGPNLDKMIQDTCVAAMERNMSYTGRGTQFHQNDERFSCRIWCHRDSGASDYMGVLPDGAECFASGQPKNGYCVKGSCMRFDCHGNSIDIHREPLPSEWTCVAPVIRRNPKVSPTKPPSHTRGSGWRRPDAARKTCRHSCIRGGRGTLHKLGCTDCAMDSISLCDDHSECKDGLISVDEYATNLCEKYRRRFAIFLSGIGKQRQYSDEMDDADEQCVVTCQDRTNPLVFFNMDTFEDTLFPPGTPCLSDGGSRGYCQFGKCIDETKFQASLYRTTHHGGTRDQRFNSRRNGLYAMARVPRSVAEPAWMFSSRERSFNATSL